MLQVPKKKRSMQIREAFMAEKGLEISLEEKKNVKTSVHFRGGEKAEEQKGQSRPESMSHQL